MEQKDPHPSQSVQKKTKKAARFLTAYVNYKSEDGEGGESLTVCSRMFWILQLW